MSNPSQSTRILRVPRIDAKTTDAFCLLSVVTHSANDSPDSPALSGGEVQLEGTDLRDAFAGTLSPRTLQQLRSDGYDGSAAEWAAVLAKSLLGRQPRDEELLDRISDVALVARVTKDRATKSKHIVLVWQRPAKSAGGVATELGSLSLGQTEDVEIDLPAWLAISCQASSAAEDEAARLRRSLGREEGHVAALSEQVEGMIEAKRELEQMLFAKFAVLINAKKRKIRELQRIITEGGGAAPSAAADDATPMASTPTASAAPQRAAGSAAKRKATAAAAESDTDSSDAFDEPLHRSDEDMNTPSASDDDTDDGGKDVKMKGTSPPTAHHGIKRTIGGKAKRAAATSSKELSPPPTRAKKSIMTRIGAKKTEQESESSDDAFDEPSKSKPKAKAPAKNKTTRENDDSDATSSDAFEDAPPPNARAKPAPKVIATKKQNTKKDSDATSSDDAFESAPPPARSTRGSQAKSTGSREEPAQQNHTLPPVRRGLPFNSKSKSVQSQDGGVKNETSQQSSGKGVVPATQDDDSETEDEL